MSRADGRRGVVLAVLACLVFVAAVWAMTIGSTPLPGTVVVEALARFDGSRDHIVVWNVRLPRVLAGLLVGSALAMAGAIMQAVTSNPLASPGLLGINAGAAFAVVLTLALFGARSSATHVWAAFLGAAVAAATVHAAASFGSGGATPLKLALAGAVLGSFLGALTTAILIFDQGTLDQIRLWAVGSLEGRSLEASLALAPYILTGVAAALLLRAQITTLSLGADISAGLGQAPLLWRGLAALVVVMLAGSAVALAGPIGFVGLVVPHIGRSLLGADYRWVLPFSALGGALLVVSADALARILLPGQGLPVGVTMALLGAPFFIYLARYRLGGMR